MGNKINRKKHRMFSQGKLPAEVQLKMTYNKTVHLTRRMDNLLEIRRLWQETKRKCEILFPHCRNVEFATQYFDLISKRLKDVEEEILAVSK